MIGIDSLEPDLVDLWADAGLLPTFDWLRSNGTSVHLSSPIPGLGSAVWPEVNYGIGVARTGVFNIGVPQYFPREGVLRETREDEIPATSLFWIEASRAGKRVATIDQVYAVPEPGSEALQLIDWGVHDRPFPARSAPSDFLADIDTKHGPYPVVDCDAVHGGTAVGYARLTGQLEQGAEVKADLITDLLAESDWDLMTCTFTEAHCAGHQMWHLMESGPTGIPDPSDGMLRTYVASDRALGRVIEAAGPDALIAVISNKGMGPNVGGPHLMTEVLHRLGLGAERRLRRRLWDRVPATMKSRMMKTLPPAVRDPLRRRAAVGAEPGFKAGSKAISIRSDQDAVVRLNLVGRDVHGVVRPGAEADRLLDELRTELLNLRHPTQSSQAIVEKVVIVDDEWDSNRAETIPDMIVHFRQDLGAIESCTSDRVGRIAIPLASIRTGNHNSHHRAWVVGAGVSAGATASAHTIDIAPTLLARLGVPIPADMEGIAIPALGGLAV